MNDAPVPPSADPPPQDAPPPPEPPRREGGVLAWVRAIGFAVVAALVLRLFAFEAYRIPSTSMEDTLLAGDFLFVSKLAYGARLPRLLGGPEARLPGLSTLRRGDIVVFNHPPEPGPVERRTPFIKRLVGLPGDTLRIVGKRVVVNGDTLDAPPLGRHLWRVRYTRPDGVSAEALAALGVRVRGGHSTERLVEGTADEALRVAALEGVEHIEAFVRPPQDGSAHFPAAPAYSLDDYGPIVVPRRGLTVPLNDATWLLYREAIAREAAAFGRPAPRSTAEGFVVDSVLADEYTFRDDHLFVMGDNRDDSEDSRTWGFVPRTYVIGRASLIYFSWDDATGRARWHRAMRWVE